MCSFSGATCTSRDVTMQITFLTRKSALIYRRDLRQRVASLTLNCNGVLAIRAYTQVCKHDEYNGRVIDVIGTLTFLHYDYSNMRFSTPLKCQRVVLTDTY